MIDRAVAVERTTAFVLPGANDRRNTACCVHVDGTVARSGKAVAETKIGARPLADQTSERLDRVRSAAGNRGGPLRPARAQMYLKFGGRVGVTSQIVAIRLAVAEQTMHHRAGKRAVATGTNEHRKIGLLHRAVHVDVNDGNLGVAFF